MSRRLFLVFILAHVDDYGIDLAAVVGHVDDILVVAVDDVVVAVDDADEGGV